MSDRAILELLVVIGFITQMAGLVFLALQVRQFRRETRTPQVEQEVDRLCALFEARLREQR